MNLFSPNIFNCQILEIWSNINIITFTIYKKVQKITLTQK